MSTRTKTYDTHYTAVVGDGISPTWKQVYGEITVPAAIVAGTNYFKAVQGLVTALAGSSVAELWGLYGIVVSSADADSLWGCVGELDVAAGVLGPGAGQDNSFQAAGYFHSYISTTASLVAGKGIDAPLVGDIWSKTGRRKANAAVAAVLNGDVNQSTAGAGAAFKAYNFNTGAKFDFGLDLFSDVGAYVSDVAKADVRLTKEVCILQGAGAPVDGGAGTGATFAEKGSMYIDRTNGNAYLNAGAGTKAAPVWKLVTRAA